MEYNDYFVLFVTFCLGWFCSRQVFLWRLRKTLQDIAEKSGINLDELETTVVEKHVIKVPNFFTEKLEHSILLYKKDTKEFMCQAKDINELASLLSERNKIEYALVDHDDQKVWFVHGKVRHSLKEIA